MTIDKNNNTTNNNEVEQTTREVCVNGGTEGERPEREMPLVAHPEETGLTPEEEAYVLQTESRPLPRSVFALILAVLVLAFAGGGAFYYQSAVRPERLYQKATRLFYASEYADALALYQKVLRARPERRDTLYQIGYCQEMLGMDQEAAVSYSRHLENQPRDLNALLRLGNVMLRMGLLEEALPPFERATRIAPRNAEAHHALGKIYEYLQSEQRAVENYKTAVENSDDIEMLLSASKALTNLKRYEDALEGYEKARAFSGSGDNRGLHGARAARDMLGWPSDPAVIITPGQSLGMLALDTSEADVAAALGEPDYKETGTVNPVGRENWVYKGGELVVYFSGGRVQQIMTTSPKYRTANGLGIANFLEPKYAERFDRWLDSDTENPGRRYILRGGGLAFYASGENLAAIIYRGEYPPTDSNQEYWTRIK